jgi:multidrug efflux pump
MSLSTTSIKRPVLAIVMSLVIMLFGGLGFSYLGVREYPAIDPPIINVRTSYTGANAEVIESQITEPLEKAINGIDGIRTISSASNLGSSQITVEFNLDADLEAAANDVRDKVSQAVRTLPQDIDGLPVVSKADASSDAIVALTLQSDKLNRLQLSDYAENVIAQRLQTIPGVNTIQIWGQQRYAMRIWLDPQKLAAYNLTPADVSAAITRENVEVPGGKIYGANTELVVRTLGRLKTEADFEGLIISNQADRNIRLGDVGRAELGSENPETILRESGIPMVGLGVVPQPGSNYLDIAEEFYKRYDVLKKELPKDFKLNVALDNTKFITQSVEEVEETLLIAIILVVLIIYLFFRDWVIAIRPLIDIPVSLIGTFFIMYIFGFSINILTLLAIVMATGLVVDDGIVVTENIYKKIEAGMRPMEAAIEGSKEIFFAVISTSLTLAAVFMPVIFMEGFVGRLFREFGVVIAAAVLISAFVSLTLTPMLNAKLFRKDQKKSRFYIMTEPFFEAMENGYRNSLAAFLKVRAWAFVILAACFAIAIGFWITLPDELAPLEDRGNLRLAITGPESSSFGYTDAFMLKLGKLVKDSVPESEMVLTVTAPGFTGSGAVNTGFVRLRLSDAKGRERSQKDIAAYLGKKVSGFSEGKVFVQQEQTISASGGVARGGLPVQYVIQAPNFEKLKEVLPKFMEEVGKNQTFQGFDVNLKFNKPEFTIIPDRQKAKLLGVSVADIGQALQLSFSGTRIGYFTMNNKQYQVMSQFDYKDRNKPLDLKSLYVRNDKGELIQLDNVVKFDETASPPQIYHYNRYMSATVQAGLAPGKTIGDGIEEMDKIAAKVLDDSFTTALAGASRDFAESSSNVLFALGLAIILIYLLLAAQFESFIDPFIILLTIVPAAAGALLSLWYFNQTKNIFSEIGLIMLIGLVTKNGILIVEFSNHVKETGKSVVDAVLEGSVMRLRPILMTSIATALGALPIALALGSGAQSRVPMGIVVVCGLMFSVVLTLYLIPAMYSYMSREHKTTNDEA